jgi:PAS domain S-box-containing protein
MDKENDSNKLNITKNEISILNQEKENLEAELIIANKELVLQNKEIENRLLELVVAHRENKKIGVDLIKAIENEKRLAQLLIADKALIVSEERYRRLFEAAQDGILILNVDTGVIEDVNPFMMEMLGYSYTEFLGKELWEIGLLSDIHANMEAFLKLKEEGYIRYKDLPLKTKSGCGISVEFVSNRYDVSGGQVIQCNIRNITERKIAEDNNKQLTERLKLATQSAKLGIWDWDINNNILKWDAGMYLLYDLLELEVELVYEGWLSSIHPEDIERVNHSMQQALLGKEEFSPIFRLVLKDSSVRYIEASGIIERDAQGNAIRMIGTNWDITLKTEKERHLKLLESVITNTKDAVMITDAEPLDMPGPRILYVNDAFTKMTGYTSTEVIGKSPRILQGPKSDKAELRRLSEAIRRWEVCEITTINYKKNGDEFWINFTVSPVANEQGRFTHLISIERDVTDIKKYISAIENQNIKLKEIAWEQSHIVRAPLARMMGIVCILTDIKPASSEFNEWVEHFNNSATELDEIIKDIVSKAQNILVN